MTSDKIVDQASQVSLVLAGQDVFVAKGYEVKMGMIDQPGAFSIDFGGSAPPHELKAKYPKNTPFELHVGGVKQFSGRTDGWDINGGSGGTHAILRGRDSMAHVVDAQVTVEKSWSDIPYSELVRLVLLEAVPGDIVLTSGSESDRQARTGSKTKERTLKSGRRAKNTDDKSTFQAKIGQSWNGDILRPALDRAGLFLVAGVDENSFNLTTPSVDQDALGQIIHQRGSSKNQVIDYAHRDDATMRASRCEVHGRRGGGKEARSKIVGIYNDPELAELGISRPFAVADEKCTTIKQAEHYARFRAAEMRRNSWSLEYVVKGHVTRGFQSTQPHGFSVWAPDNLVQIDDNELELHGLFYLEEVTMSGKPHFTTRLRFMRVEDVLFGRDADEEA